MLTISDLYRIAKTKHALDKYESRYRTMLIRNLRGLWHNARYLEEKHAIQVVQEKVDLALLQLGAEPEGVRRARWTDAFYDPKGLREMQDLIKEDLANGHKLYMEWLGEDPQFQDPLDDKRLKF